MIDTDLIAPGMVIWAKSTDTLAEDGREHGVVVDVQTMVDEDGVIQRAFRCVHQFRGQVRWVTIPETEVGDIVGPDPSSVRSLFRLILGERACKTGTRGWQPRRGDLTSEDVQAVQTAMALLKAAGVLPGAA